MTSIIIAAEPVTDIDVTAADMLANLHDELRAAGVRLHFAEMKGPVKDRLRRYGLFESFGGESCFFATVGEAVDGFLQRRGRPISHPGKSRAAHYRPRRGRRRPPSQAH